MMRWDGPVIALPLGLGLVIVGVPITLAAVHYTEASSAGVGMAAPGAGVFPFLWSSPLGAPIVFALVSVAEIVAAKLGAWGPHGGVGRARRMWRAHAGLLVLCVIYVVQAFIHPGSGAGFYAPGPQPVGLLLSFGVALGWVIVVAGLAWPARPAPGGEPNT